MLENCPIQNAPFTISCTRTQTLSSLVIVTNLLASGHAPSLGQNGGMGDDIEARTSMDPALPAELPVGEFATLTVTGAAGPDLEAA